MRIDLPQCNFKNCRFSFDGNCTNKIEYDRCEYRLAKGELADVEPVRHGRWLTWEEILHVDKRAPNNLGVFCSMCNKHSDNMTNYCPVCGAEMDGGEKNE